MSKWVSNLATYLERYVEMKTALGFVYRSQTECLLSFDRFCHKNFPAESTITLEMAIDWVNQRSSQERNSTSNARLSVLRQFALYVRLTDPNCYVPDNSLRLKREQFVCHIITDSEFSRFFRELDLMKSHPCLPFRAETYKEFFRLLYCTGLRSGEAVSLNRDHFDWSSNTVNILESKLHAKRVVALSTDLAQRLKAYDQSLPSERLSFFSFDGVKRPALNSFSECLQSLWSVANPNSSHVRLYDFRHTFITKRILLWHQNKEPVREKLPYLMSFVGHKHIEDTLYYFRIVPELCGLFENPTEDLIPEFDEDAGRLT